MKDETKVILEALRCLLVVLEEKDAEIKDCTLFKEVEKIYMQSTRRLIDDLLGDSYK